jgi:hypothetical protein
MKRYLLSLFCMALASTAWAQNQGTVQSPVAAANVSQTTIILPGTVVSTAAPAATGGICSQGSCPQTKTVCVSQPATVVKTKVLFSSCCETVCAKGCCSLFKKASDCDSCQADGTCGHPYVKRDLYKRVEKTECPSIKCVPAQVPACAAPCAANCASGICTGSVVAVNGTPVSQMSATGSQVMPTTARLAITTSPGVVVGAPVSMQPSIGFVTQP